MQAVSSEQRFADLEVALADADASIGPAEVHGLVCALLAIAGTDADAQVVREVLPNADSASQIAARALSELTAATNNELSDDAFSFAPLLLSDDAPAVDRLQTIVDWASGFLHGLGHAAGQPTMRQRLGQEPLSEMMQDLVEITRADVADAAESADADESLMHLTEYLRVVAQMFFDEFLPLRSSGPVGAAPVPDDA
ncbi:MAG: UPF0149 family protein [Pseudomonadota bacterium]